MRTKRRAVQSWCGEEKRLKIEGIPGKSMKRLFNNVFVCWWGPPIITLLHHLPPGATEVRMLKGILLRLSHLPERWLQGRCRPGSHCKLLRGQQCLSTGPA